MCSIGPSADGVIRRSSTLPPFGTVRYSMTWGQFDESVAAESYGQNFKK
jgi:hypothetical protein